MGGEFSLRGCHPSRCSSASDNCTMHEDISTFISTMSCEIRIGTSGWHYKHWMGTFYPDRVPLPEGSVRGKKGTVAKRFPASKMLDFYARHFDAVEINNTFYR